MGNDIAGLCCSCARACARHFLLQGRPDSEEQQIHSQIPSPVTRRQGGERRSLGKLKLPDLGRFGRLCDSISDEIPKTWEHCTDSV